MNYAICIPTYKRKKPLSLELLNTEATLHYFVRPEEDDAHFYDEMKKIKNVEIHRLKYGLYELGETRENILEWCRENNIRYCVMLDDGVYQFNMIHCIDEIVEKMNSMPYNVIGASFYKTQCETLDGERHCISTKNTICRRSDIFGSVPTQAVLIDVKKAKELNLHYKSLDEVGFEDCAFFIDAIKKKAVFVCNPTWTFAAIVPNAKKAGGSHEQTISLERKYDIQMKRCKEYIGEMYGVQLQKRWRNYAQSLLTMIEIDCDYFRDVFLNYEKNEKIIDSQFRIE